MRAYYDDGIDYVCEFSTSTKGTSSSNKSPNQFTMARLPFENFEPVQQKIGNAIGGSSESPSLSSVPQHLPNALD